MADSKIMGVGQEDPKSHQAHSNGALVRLGERA